MSHCQDLQKNEELPKEINFQKSRLSTRREVEGWQRSIDTKLLEIKTEWNHNGTPGNDNHNGNGNAERDGMEIREAYERFDENEVVPLLNQIDATMREFEKEEVIKQYLTNSQILHFELSDSMKVSWEKIQETRKELKQIQEAIQPYIATLDIYLIDHLEKIKTDLVEPQESLLENIQNSCLPSLAEMIRTKCSNTKWFLEKEYTLLTTKTSTLQNQLQTLLEKIQTKLTIDVVVPPPPLPTPIVPPPHPNNPQLAEDESDRESPSKPRSTSESGYTEFFTQKMKFNDQDSEKIGRAHV